MSAVAYEPPVRGRIRRPHSDAGVRPPARLVIDLPQFCAWIAQASSGDFLAYHRGLLALDASIHGDAFKGAPQRELNRVARRAWWAAQQGLVHLVQRRLGPDDFSYLAIARQHGEEIPQPLSSVLLKEVVS